MNYLPPIVRQGIGTQYGDNFRYDVYAKDPANIVRNGNVSTWYNPNPAPPQFSVKFIPDRSASTADYEAAAAPIAQAMASGGQPTPEQSNRMRDFWNDPANYGTSGIVDGAPRPLVVSGSDANNGVIGIANNRQDFDPASALRQMLDQGAPKGRIVMSGHLPPEVRAQALNMRMAMDTGAAEEQRRIGILKTLADMEMNQRQLGIAEQQADTSRAIGAGKVAEVDPELAKRMTESIMMGQRPGAGPTTNAAPTFEERARQARTVMSNPVLETLGFTPESTAQQIGDTMLQRLDGEQAIDDSAIPAIQQYLQIQAMRNPKFLAAKDNSLQARLVREILGAKETKGTVDRMRKSKASEADQKKREGEITLENLAKPVRTLGDALMAPRRVYSPFGP